MDSQVLGGIVGSVVAAIGAIVVAVIQTISARRTRTRLDDIEDNTLTTSESIREDVMDTFGYKAGSVTSKMQMVNTQGRTEVIRTYRGVKVVREGVTLTNIPGKVWVDHPAGKIITPPKWTNGPSLPTKAVDLNVVQTGEKECVFNIEVTGGLTYDDPPLDYEFKTVYSKGVCVTREEMEEAYKQYDFKKEFHSYDVMSPIDVLDLQVVFPEGYHVQAYPIVFYLNSELTNNKELDRVRTGFDRAATKATFKVERPRIGFRYAVYWVPPSLGEVEQLGQ